MNCPQGHGLLLMTERQGVEVDYCPECRGVWLDRGELDKIVERSVAELGDRDDRDRGDRDRGDRDRDRDDRDRYRDRDDDRDDRRRLQEAILGERDHRSSGPYKKKKKRSFLEDMFDF
jgi:Zn-finger nucleic acid-binding protein